MHQPNLAGIRVALGLEGGWNSMGGGGHAGLGRGWDATIRLHPRPPPQAMQSSVLVNLRAHI